MTHTEPAPKPLAVETFARFAMGFAQTPLPPEVAHHAQRARFSLHYMVATALVQGSVRLSAFEPDRLNDPHTRALMQRIDKALDPDVDAAFPGRRGARVTITLRDGRQLTLMQIDRKGDPELPLSDADLEGKLIELAQPVIGNIAARALLRRIWQWHQSAQLC